MQGPVLHRTAQQLARRPATMARRFAFVAGLSRFLADRRGATALEFAFIAPIFVLMLTGIVQFGGIFFVQNQMASVAQDTARRLAVGDITAAQAPAYAQDRLTNWGVTFNVVASEPGDDVNIEISAPLAEVALIDVLGLFKDGTLSASSITRKFSNQ